MKSNEHYSKSVNPIFSHHLPQIFLETLKSHQFPFKFYEIPTDFPWISHLPRRFCARCSKADLSPEAGDRRRGCAMALAARVRVHPNP